MEKINFPFNLIFSSHLEKGEIQQVLLYFIIIMCFLFMSCFFLPSKMSYTTSEIATFEARKMGIELKFNTSSGKQSAFYFPGQKESSILADQLIVFYSGWLSKALDWQDFVAEIQNSSTAFLLIDYPGYGNCEGRINSKTLPGTSFGAIKALSSYLSISQDALIKNSIFLGHSFGCGAALQYATRVNVRRIVLVAPFTTIHSAAFKKFGPLAWLIPWGLNNKKFINALHHKNPRPTIIIIHGTEDRSIPVKMGRKLARLYPGWIIYHEIEGANHVDIFNTSRDIILQSLKLEEAKKLKKVKNELL